MNLNATVGPDGKYESLIDGGTVPAPDGIHFPYFHFGQPRPSASDTLAQVQDLAKWIGPRIMVDLTTSEKSCSD